MQPRKPNVGLRGLVVVSGGSMGHMIACLLRGRKEVFISVTVWRLHGDNTRLVIFIVLVVGTAELVYTS